MKKAFTLVEMIAVIVIVCLLMIIAIPSILNRFQKSKDKISSKSQEILYAATDLYIDARKTKYQNHSNNVYCVSLQKLVNAEYLTDPIIDVKSGREISLQKTIKVTVDNNLNFNHEIVEYNECTEVFYGSANAPELVTGMIPIRWNSSDNTWVKADVDNPNTQRWYDYNNRQWANAALVSYDSRDAYIQAIPGTVIAEENVLAYFVWIPRYKYKLWNVTGRTGTNPKAIDIVFESNTVTKSTGDENDNWLTHPAFTFNGSELNGFWVGKYEPSGTTDEITIKPNLPSIVGTTIGTAFNATRAMEATGNDYGLSKNDADSHLMKNTEWGAVAYLTSSIYGRYTNSTACISSGCDVWTNNTRTTPSNLWGPTITGCSGTSIYSGGVYNATACETGYSWNEAGVNATTTGNLTGIYDMSGGTWEYVMGNMNDNTGNYNASISLLSNPGNKYYDSYAYSLSNYLDHERGLLGDATKETLKTNGYGTSDGSWYNERTQFPHGNDSWFIRGGYSNGAANSGLFNFYYFDGGAHPDVSFRIVIVPEDEENLYVEENLNGADPELEQGMIPIRISGQGVVTIADIKTEWYNYQEKKWANVVLVDVSDAIIKDKYFDPDMTLKKNLAGKIIPASDILQYYVWIPRFKYQLFNVANVPVSMQEIKVIFEDKNVVKSVGSTNGSWLTHPAFTFGSTNLNGIWVGKFEVTGTINNMTVLPDSIALVSQNISSFFNASRQIETTPKYGLDSTVVDTHIIKNTDWGAVAYLTQSQYGLCDNGNCRTIAVNNNQYASSNSTNTGCSSGVETVAVSVSATCPVANKWYTAIGQRASTTQNMSGIYDMSGGSFEYVLGMTNNSAGNFYSSSSGFTDAPEEKYYNAYIYLASGENSTRGSLGDATREVLLTNANATGGWNTDYAAFPNTSNNYFRRGGAASHTSNAGIFAYHRAAGGANSAIGTRLIITKD